MGTFLIATGFSFIVVFSFLWLLNTGRIYAWSSKLSASLPKGSLLQRSATVVAGWTLPQEVVKPVRRSVIAAKAAEELPRDQVATTEKVPLKQRLASLSVGNVVRLTATDGSNRALEVQGVVTHHELYQENGKWSRTGDSFLLAQFSTGEWIWVRGANIAFFNKALQVGDEVITRFKSRAQEYGKGKQAYEDGQLNDIPTIVIEIEGISLKISDIGKSDLEVDGLCDVEDGGARFIFAEATDSSGRVAWIQDATAGSDLILLGRRLVVSDIDDIQ